MPLPNLDKIELEFVSNILNSKKKSNKLYLFIVILFLLNAIMYSVLAIINNNELIFNLIIAVIWFVGFGVNLHMHIKNKKFIKNLKVEQNRLLKKVDYKKYIKNQRKNKLKKIKKTHLK